MLQPPTGVNGCEATAKPLAVDNWCAVVAESPSAEALFVQVSVQFLETLRHAVERELAAEV